MTAFHSPPFPKNANGDSRHAGFEFELAGMDTKTCAECIAALLEGEIHYAHSLEADITNTSLGTFRVELDAKMVKKLAAKLEAKSSADENEWMDASALRAQLSEWMGGVAGQLVPLEVVTPPIAFAQFDAVERLREVLHKNKAQGTRAVLTNAFGLHINPDIASESVAYIRDIMRAFLVLYPWLRTVMQVDVSRRLLTYIDPFPADYMKLVLPDHYDPSLDRFIADYLHHNPTRNRALDLLPLFAHLAPESLKPLDEADRELVKARPAFHYRLPNCEIDDANWSVARDWNYWVEVERLAKDRDRLAEIARDYLVYLENPLNLLSAGWVEQLEKRYGYTQ